MGFSLSPLVTSPELSHSFTVEMLKSGEIDILSVFNDKLLVGRKNFPQLFILSQEGNHLETFTIDSDGFIDATWTLYGNIVYTTSKSKLVMLKTLSGELIAYTQMTNPQDISVSNDGVIYLADAKAGIYQSTDDGISWNLVFKHCDGWLSRQVVKVNTDHGEEFWVLERGNIFSKNVHLRVYGEVDKRKTLRGSSVPLKDNNLNTPDGRRINLVDSKLLYDGYNSIFLSECYNKAVHLFSVNGHYLCQLLSSCHIKNQPYRLAMDKECQQLYVGQKGGVVDVFKLIYGDNEGSLI